jgi:hypothetical protein
MTVGALIDRARPIFGAEAHAPWSRAFTSWVVRPFTARLVRGLGLALHKVPRGFERCDSGRTRAAYEGRQVDYLVRCRGETIGAHLENRRRCPTTDDGLS